MAPREHFEHAPPIFKMGKVRPSEERDLPQTDRQRNWTYIPRLEAVFPSSLGAGISCAFVQALLFYISLGIAN